MLCRQQDLRTCQYWKKVPLCKISIIYTSLGLFYWNSNFHHLILFVRVPLLLPETLDKTFESKIFLKHFHVKRNQIHFILKDPMIKASVLAFTPSRSNIFGRNFKNSAIFFQTVFSKRKKRKKLKGTKFR